MIVKRELPRLITFVVRCAGSAVLAYWLAQELRLSYPIWANPSDPMYRTGIYRGSEVILGGLIGGTFHQLTEKLLGLANRLEYGPVGRKGLESTAQEDASE